MNKTLMKKFKKGPDDTWTYAQKLVFYLEKWRKECEERDGKKFNVELVNLAKFFPEEAE